MSPAKKVAALSDAAVSPSVLSH